MWNPGLLTKRNSADDARMTILADINITWVLYIYFPVIIQNRWNIIVMFKR